MAGFFAGILTRLILALVKSPYTEDGAGAAPPPSESSSSPFPFSVDEEQGNERRSAIECGVETPVVRQDRNKTDHSRKSHGPFPKNGWVIADKDDNASDTRATDMAYPYKPFASQAEYIPPELCGYEAPRREKVFAIPSIDREGSGAQLCDLLDSGQ